MEKNKHLTLVERLLIEEKLKQKQRITAIARILGKDPTTIAKEILLHATTRRNGVPGRNYNNCRNQFHCKKTCLCISCNAPRHYSYCHFCSMCNKVCTDFEPQVCTRLAKSPHVCNGCGKIGECNFEKRLYIAASAQEEYRTTLVESRSGISFTEDELTALDELISPLIKQNQSPHHICATSADSLMISERSVYRLIDANLISAINLDLPRKVRFKPRKKKRSFKVDKSCRINRDFECFKKYMEEHPDTPVVEIDSVEGKKGGKVLLTIHFVKCEMMLAFLRDANTAKSVEDIFDALYTDLGQDCFSNIFPLLLADNGSEFSNPSRIEFDENQFRRTRVFYCDPNAPYQKGSAERNHEFIRYFIPKGKDLSAFTQYDISVMMNHINSYCRASLGNKSPYDVFRFLYGNKLLDLLGCTTIPAQQVTLNSSVFRKEVSE